VHPEVVDHGYPEEGEGRDDLEAVAGVATLGEAFGDAGAVEVEDGLAHEAVVAGYVEGYEGLDAGIAFVLELFVVGAVVVGFTGAAEGGSPSDVPYLAEGAVVGAEGGLLGEWVSGGVRGEVDEGEGLGSGLDVEL